MNALGQRVGRAINGLAAAWPAGYARAFNLGLRRACWGGLWLCGASAATAAFGVEPAPVAEPDAPASAMVSAERDERLRDLARSVLAVLEGVAQTEVQVDCADGDVTLRGALAPPATVEKAVSVVRSIRGVRAVDASQLRSKLPVASERPPR